MSTEHTIIFVLLGVIILLLLFKREHMNGLPPYLTSGATLRHSTEFSAADQAPNEHSNAVSGPSTFENTGIMNADLSGYVGSPMGTDMYNSGATLRDVGPVFTSSDQGPAYQYDDPTYNSKYLLKALEGD